MGCHHREQPRRVPAPSDATVSSQSAASYSQSSCFPLARARRVVVVRTGCAATSCHQSSQSQARPLPSAEQPRRVPAQPRARRVVVLSSRDSHVSRSQLQRHQHSRAAEQQYARCDFILSRAAVLRSKQLCCTPNRSQPGARCSWLLSSDKRALSTSQSQVRTIPLFREVG